MGAGWGWGGVGEPSPPGRVQGTRGRVLAAVRTRRRTGRRGLRGRAAGTTGPWRRDRADLAAGGGSTKPQTCPPHLPAARGHAPGPWRPPAPYFKSDPWRRVGGQGLLGLKKKKNTATGSRFAPIKYGGKAFWSPREHHGMTSSRRDLSAHAPKSTPPEGMRLGRGWVVNTRAQ